MVRPSAIDTIQIAEVLACCAAHLDPRDQELQLALFRLLAEGEPVPPAHLAETVGIPTSAAVESLERWHGVHADAEGRIVAFGGLSIVEGPHRLRVDGRTLHAWCAWDTLFLPELIGFPADVRSCCPVTGRQVSLRVDREGPSELSPTEAVLSFLLPGAAYANDVIAGFCRFVHFFASPEAGERWTARHPGCFVISIAEGFEIGRLTNDAQFGEALHGAR
jgi:alkylmercury lyase